METLSRGYDWAFKQTEITTKYIMFYIWLI